MIKRILALKYVCKKYGLKPKIKLFGDEGWVNTIDRSICVPLFQKHFYQTLYHEVGHLVAERSLRYKAKYFKAYLEGPRITLNGGDVFIRLQEEATASKFSHRLLQTKDKSHLKQAWYSYTGFVAEVINASELDRYITTVAKYNKYFEER